jgi:hypothetical protein
MKKSKSIIAAAGGVLAVGFLAIPAPAAHAAPCIKGGMGVSQACQDCLAANAGTAGLIGCWDTIWGPGSGGPPVNTPMWCPPNGVAISGQNCALPGSFSGTPRFKPAAYPTWDWCAPLLLPGYDALHASCEARLQHACAIGDPICRENNPCPPGLTITPQGCQGGGGIPDCSIYPGGLVPDLEGKCVDPNDSGYTGRAPRYVQV